jgi:thymidylate synthase (FAD)
VKIIEPSFKLLVPKDRNEGIRMLQTIERFARISHRAEEKQTDDTWFRFIKSVVLDHGDWSVVEHAYSSVVFRVSRGVTHELVRHRLFSYTQESTRFVNGRKSYPDGLEFIRPINLPATPSVTVNFERSCQEAEDCYLGMLDANVRPQEARSVLPNALAATIAVTGNLRNWRHLFIMRTSKETHPDFKQVSVPLLAQFQERIPLLFDDIVPEERQIDAMRKAR